MNNGQAYKRCRCDGCENPVKKNAFFYCSVRCQKQYEYEQYIVRWLAGEADGSTSNGDVTSRRIRRYLMESGGFKCSICGWSERNPRTVLFHCMWITSRVTRETTGPIICVYCVPITTR